MKILNRTICDKSKYLNEKLFRFMKKTSQAKITRKPF